MSVTKLISIHCDTTDCGKWEEDYHWRTVAEARKDLRAYGWAHSDGKDVCPGCQQKGSSEGGA